MIASYAISLVIAHCRGSRHEGCLTWDCYFPLTHQVLNLACKKAFKRYIQQSNQLETVQRRKLNHFLRLIESSSAMRYEQFAEKYPLTRYADWKAKLKHSRQSGENRMGTGHVLRFQPTSGSRSRGV